ncbi:hypothetical protein PVL29_026364 [Vitis rotundifolia]|uniref:Uncharacterized protein n=1 Tax=Vitis rotundifolia TaxID=103349 RepID=A0AA38YM90_VITRO|nr:hypothetical protein PVL29_026364 [Vitis rotundifolia]
MLVIKERNGEDRVPEKLSIEEEEEPCRQMEIYIEDEEDQVSETYKEDERPVEEEPEKPSIEEEEDPWRSMKIFVEGIIEHLHDDLENQWNLRMKQNIGVGLDLPRLEMDEDEDPPPKLPKDFKVHIREMNDTHPILVLEKQLFKTDINKGENRFSMPLNQIKREFLSEDEKIRVVERMQVKLI